MPGRRRASMVLPPPGGPMSSRECAPAAAISSARRASAWPCTSHRSPSAAGRACPSSSRADACTATGGSRSSRMSMAWRSVRAPSTRMPGTSAASAALASGTTSCRQPRRAACSAITSTPGTGRSAPSSASSPTAPVDAMAPGRTCPDPLSTASAMGRSYCGPALRTCAGARLATMRMGGRSKAWLTMPDRTRSRASCTAASGRPTTLKPGSPGRRSTSTSTVAVSRPMTAGLTMRATTARIVHGHHAHVARGMRRRRGPSATVPAAAGAGTVAGSATARPRTWRPRRPSSPRSTRHPGRPDACSGSSGSRRAPTRRCPGWASCPPTAACPGSACS